MKGKLFFRYSLIFNLCIGIMVSTLNLDSQAVTIPVVTQSYAIILQTDEDNRLRTVYFGESFKNISDYPLASGILRLDDRGTGIYNSAYTPSGTWNISEPAIQIVHSDGNTSLELKYISHSQVHSDFNVTLTSIILKDPLYSFQVTLFYKTWHKENIIEQWTEIQHHEEKAVQLKKYASANLYLTNKNFYLTSFGNHWAEEMRPIENKLVRGVRSFESVLGTRAMLLQSSNFILSFNNPASENEGMVILGQLAWSGNFKFNFEIDPFNNLRLIAGINPYNSEYLLLPGKIFKTPSLIYAVSNRGTGEASRNLHTWARKNRILDGSGDRLTLLNNWEATYFDFDEEKITALFKDAKELGVDLFLLDDGWFGNKYPRNNDRAGLGDWQENAKKLPNGIGHLVRQAEKEGVKFGIWIEPEMVNPRSELYENHPDWVIKQPGRTETYYRNQLVLDLSNPEVQDFVFGIVDKLLRENPGLAFIKWDCNAVMYNPFSAYLEKMALPQTHLYVEYVNGLYNVLKRIRKKYPEIPMMLCSGGGGRGDYEILKYFTEFWPSDNTEPLERIFIQWNYSYFFPPIISDNHVTEWGKQPLKFRVDVASMGKLGFDIVFNRLNDNDKLFCKQAVSNYNRFRNIIWHGDLYRLVNPHFNDISALMYVNLAKSKALVFSFLVNNRYRSSKDELPVRLQGLDPDKKYSITETNLYPDTKSVISSKQIYSGDFLMKAGINPVVNLNRTSVVLEINEVK